VVHSLRSATVVVAGKTRKGASAGLGITSPVERVHVVERLDFIRGK